MIDHHGPLPESLLREGQAMAQAVAADVAACEGFTVSLLRDMRAASLVAFGGELIEVDSLSAHNAALMEQANRADAVLMIAPETDGALLHAVRQVEAIGAKLISPSAAFIEIASDKERTAERLSVGGVATPAAARLEPHDPLPQQFDYPAVIKPLDGAGSQDMHIVTGAHDRPPAYAWPRRLERYVPGIAVSVALLGVAGGEPAPLPACRQRLTSDGRFGYLGGSTPLVDGLAERATQLAVRAVKAMPPLIGYAGVDLVLGSAPDGRDDVVIEINPRLTTSYVGLRAACQGNLVQAMLGAAKGKAPLLEFDPRPLAYDADGAVYFDGEER